jgi:anaerobic selenocysteine-containing dehydrogenase
MFCACGQRRANCRLPSAIDCRREMPARCRHGVAHDMDALPNYLPNHETPGGDPRYPLAMISPPARHFLNSSFVDVESLREMGVEPLLEIHADDALARGIANGQTVHVFNDRGEYRCRVEVAQLSECL